MKPRGGAFHPLSEPKIAFPKNSLFTVPEETRTKNYIILC